MPVNQAPVLSSVATDCPYTENDPATAIAPGLVITDSDSATLALASVHIGSGRAGGDLLTVDTTGTNITPSYDSSTGTLTLTGVDTLADYQAVLRTVCFVSSSDNPTVGGSRPTRTITWIVDDGAGTNHESAPANTTVEITAVNDPPSLTGLASSVTFGENLVNATPQVLDNTVTLTDPDGTFSGGGMTVTGLLGEDVVSVRNQGSGAGQIGYNGSTHEVSYGGVVFATVTGGNGTDMSISFGPAVSNDAVDALIENLTYANTSNEPTATRDLTIVVNDASPAYSTPAVITVNVTPEPEVINGTSGPDTLTGTSGDDVISGFAGDDLLSGLGGHNTMDGGGGVDTVTYASASTGVTVDLSLTTEQNTGLGFDTLSNVENLVGSAFADTLRGDGHVNRIDGGAGYDSIYGGAGDTLNGGGGDDTIYIDGVPAAVDGGTDGVNHLDTLVLTVGMTLDLTTIKRIEQINVDQTGSTVRFTGHVPGGATPIILITAAGGASVVGSDFTDSITDGPGADTINGGAGDDFIFGNAGDVLIGGTGDDVISVFGTPASISGGSGADEVVFQADATLTNVTGIESYFLVDKIHNADLSAVSQGATITADGRALVHIVGTQGDDVIHGGDKADTLDGSGGADQLFGGEGNDTFFVDNSGDQVFETSGEGFDTVNAAVDFTLGAGEEVEVLRANAGSTGLTLGGNELDNQIFGGSGIDTATYAAAGSAVTVSLAVKAAQDTGGAGHDTLKSIENLTGSSFGDTLSGNSGDNALSGGSGDDVLNGGGGDDLLDGGAGTDTASYAGAGEDVKVSLALSGPQDTKGAGVDTLVGIENLIGSSGKDKLTGDDGANALSGGAGKDVLDGAGGADTLTGGLGNDLFAFHAIGDSTSASPDLITDFTAGDHIDLSMIDADVTKGGNQAFHLGGGGGHAGDIVVSLADFNLTQVDLYVDNDGTPDATILLSGDHTGLTAGDFVL